MLTGTRNAIAVMIIALSLIITSPFFSNKLDSNIFLIVFNLFVMFATTYIFFIKMQNTVTKVNEDDADNFVMRSDLNVEDKKVSEKLKDIKNQGYQALLNQDKKGITWGVTTDKNLNLNVSYDEMVRHTAIIGQSGVGKTVLVEDILFQHCLINGGGGLFIDAKYDAEVRDRLLRTFALFGRQDDILVININEPDLSNTYNPILNGDGDEIADRIMNLMPSAENSPGADFYRQSAYQVISALASALVKNKTLFTPSDLAILMSDPNRIVNKILDKLEDCTEKTELYRLIGAYKKTVKGPDNVPVQQIDKNKFTELVGGLTGRINRFGSNNFGKIMNTYAPEVDILDAMQKNKLIYIMLPTMGKNETSLQFAKMMISDLRSVIGRVQENPSLKPKKTFVCIMDEFGAYAQESASRLFEQARSANVALVPAFQSFSQLNKVSTDFKDIVIQNTWNKVFFKFGSEDEASIVSELIGKTKKHATSLSVTSTENTGINNTRTDQDAKEANVGGVGYSLNESFDVRVRSDVIKKLKMGEAIVISGVKAFHIKTKFIRENENEIKDRHPKVYRVPTKPKKGWSKLNLIADIEREMSGSVNLTEKQNEMTVKNLKRFGADDDQAQEILDAIINKNKSQFRFWIEEKDTSSSEKSIYEIVKEFTQKANDSMPKTIALDILTEVEMIVPNKNS